MGHKYSLSTRPASLNRQANLARKTITSGLKTQFTRTYKLLSTKLMGGPLRGSVLLKGLSDILST